MSSTNKLIAIEAEVAFESINANEGETSGPPRFNSRVYNGGPIEVAGYDKPIVIDLAGLESKRNIVANLDHVKTARVGKVTSRSDEGGVLTLAGLANAATAARDEVVASAKDGFTWEASIEASPLKIDQLAKGKSVVVNGRTVEGPLYVVRAAKLTGFAFVSHGADEETDVSIAASRSPSSRGSGMKKKVEAWAKSLGVDVDNLTEEQQRNIEANYEGRNGTPRSRTKPSDLEDVFEREAADRERRAKIADITARAISENPYAGSDFVDRLKLLATKAIEAEWDSDKFELELLRQSRPIGHGVGRSSREQVSEAVIEAALARSGGLPDIEKKFAPQVLEACDKAYPRGIGLKQLIAEAAHANGYRGSGFQITADVLRAAFTPVQAGAGFSTLALPGILSNTANKFLLQGWNSVDSTWSRICSRRPVNNFLTQTSYSLTGGFEYDKVGPGGELKHASVGEETYTNKAETFGKLFAITRQDLINDNLGALTQVPMKLGRGAALKLNKVFWTEFLNNSSFFTTGNANVSTGGGSVLGFDGLKAAEIKFMNQTDPDGQPLGIMPAILLAPPTLASTARTLMQSQGLIDGTATAAQGSTNIWAGKFRPETSPYMENVAYTGYSAAAWYLLADPNDLSVIEVCFLNGRETPVIETADADFNSLGIQMRGYHDFGVAKQEPRAGVRSAGS